MGLIMLILIGILPTTFAVDLGTSQQSIEETRRDRGNHLVPDGPACARRRDGGIPVAGGRACRRI